MKTSLIHLVVGVILAALFAGGYFFGTSVIEGERTRSEELSTLIEARSGAQAKGALARAELETLALDEAEVQRHFVSTADVVSFLENLESVGRGFGAVVEVISVSDTAAAGSIDVALSVTGTFDSVMRTVGVIEHGPVAVTVKNLTLDAGEHELWTAAVSFSAATKDTP